MIDLIMPVYNNTQGVLETICSLNLRPYLQDIIQITIVDDCSQKDYDYSKILDMFQNKYSINIIYKTKNEGPGKARQDGINATSNKYFLFVDAGDLFLSPLTLEGAIKGLLTLEDPVLIGYMQQDENRFGSLININANHNRFHGKIYNRDFMNKYNIRLDIFPSKANEDIGFNLLYKLCLKYDNAILNKEENARQYLVQSPLITTTYDQTSITRSDDEGFFFQKQNIGLAKCIVEIVNFSIANNIPESFYLDIIHEMFVSTYFTYLATINHRPEYAAESLNGAKYFFNYIFKANKIKYDENIATNFFNSQLKDFYIQQQGHPTIAKIPKISFYDFLKQIS